MASSGPSLRSKAKQRPDLLLRGACGLLNAWWHRLKFLICFKRVKLGAWTRIYGKLSVVGSGKIVIGRNCMIVSDQGRQTAFVTLNKEAEIVVGERSTFGGCTLQAAKSIRVGNLCALALGVTISDTQAHSLRADRRTNHDAPVEVQPVVLEDNVWLSLNVVVLHGVRIGKDSVIGANALVTKDIPSGVLAFGSPAKVQGPLPQGEDA